MNDGDLIINTFCLKNFQAIICRTTKISRNFQFTLDTTLEHNNHKTTSHKNEKNTKKKPTNLTKQMVCIRIIFNKLRNHIKCLAGHADVILLSIKLQITLDLIENMVFVC